MEYTSAYIMTNSKKQLNAHENSHAKDDVEISDNSVYNSMKNQFGMAMKPSSKNAL